MAVSPRRVSRQKESANYEVLSEIPAAKPDFSVDGLQTPGSKAAIIPMVMSAVVVFASIGFLVYLIAFSSSALKKPIESNARKNLHPIAIAPISEGQPKAIKIAIASRRANKESSSTVQLASASAQEPEQSDPNKPPPFAPSKKPPSSTPPAKLPVPNTEVSPPPAMPSSANPKTPELTGGSASGAKSEPLASSKDGEVGPKTSVSSPPSQSGSATTPNSPPAAPSGANKDVSNKPATPPTPPTPAPSSGNGNSTLKEFGVFVRDKLTPVFEGGVFASYSLFALRTETTGATSIRFTDSISESSRERVVDSNFGVGQKGVLGIQGNLVGYRASYSSFLEETSRFDRPDFRSLWPDLSSMSRIEMQIADIEVIQKHSINEICLESFFGVRYAEYRGADMALGVGKFAKNLEAHAIAHSFRETEGIGPTFGMSAKQYLPWKFGCGMFESCETNDCGNLGWSWFWSLRGSVLRTRVLTSAYTESQLGIYSQDSGVQGIARSADQSYLDQSREMNLFNGELQLGIEYSRPLVFIPATASFRTSLVCQYWDTGPALSTSQSFAGLSGNSPDFSGRVDSLAISDNRYLNLFGVNLTMGLNY